MSIRIPKSVEELIQIVTNAESEVALEDNRPLYATYDRVRRSLIRELRPMGSCTTVTLTISPQRTAVLPDDCIEVISVETDKFKSIPFQFAPAHRILGFIDHPRPEPEYQGKNSVFIPEYYSLPHYEDSNQQYIVVNYVRDITTIEDLSIDFIMLLIDRTREAYVHGSALWELYQNSQTLIHRSNFGVDGGTLEFSPCPRHGVTNFHNGEIDVWVGRVPHSSMHVQWNRVMNCSDRKFILYWDVSEFDNHIYPLVHRYYKDGVLHEDELKKVYVGNKEISFVYGENIHTFRHQFTRLCC